MKHKVQYNLKYNKIIIYKIIIFNNLFKYNNKITKYQIIKFKNILNKMKNHQFMKIFNNKLIQINHMIKQIKVLIICKT